MVRGKVRNNTRYFLLIPLILIAIHAFLMNGHYHVYRQLTVGTYLDPIIAKADPSLFKNSFYVQAVNRTKVRLSLFFDVSPFIVKHFDFETFAMAQAFCSLFLSFRVFLPLPMFFSEITPPPMSRPFSTAQS